MATQAELDTVNAQIAQYQAQLGELGRQIAQLEGEIVEYNNKAKEAVWMRHNAEEDAARIEAKLEMLKASTEEGFAQHTATVEAKAKSVLEKATELVEAKAKSVLEKATELVEGLRAETKKRLDKTRDPATGLRSPYELILLNLFDLHREEALTADEYGRMALPAAAYDEQAVKGIDYDLYGKRLLKLFEGVEARLTAEGYDALDLTAEEYAGYLLTAAGYDLSAGARLGRKEEV